MISQNIISSHHSVSRMVQALPNAQRTKRSPGQERAIAERSKLAVQAKPALTAGLYSGTSTHT